MGQFKSGTGLMAVELGVPVVPVHVEGTREVLPKDAALPRRGRVSVRFGKPMTFAPDASPLDATHAIEAAVRGLAEVEAQATQPLARM